MKPRNLVIWAGFTCACLTLLFSCTQLANVAQFIGLGQEKVKLTPEELQRLVYSSHVLTVIDDKPELEGALLALRELHRENPQASPVSLVKPVKWALDEYRKEASSRTLPMMWRDEVLGRYFLKFSEDPNEYPGLSERRDVVLNLLNVLLTQQDAGGLVEELEERFHAGSQRLLAVERGPGERQALVESCMQRAQRDPNFAAAMDDLVGSQTKHTITLGASPKEILAANPALGQNPTMQELMRFSPSSQGGTVEITVDELEGLFQTEMAEMEKAATKALTTSVGRHREIIQARELAAEARIATIKRHARAAMGTVAEQRQRIAASRAAAMALSRLVLPKEPKKARDWWAFATNVATVAGGVCTAAASLVAEPFTAGASTLGVVAGVATVAAGTAGLVSSCEDAAADPGGGKTKEEVMLDAIKRVGQMVTELSNQMHDRFDRVDRSLAYVLEDLRSAVLLIGEVRRDVDEVRRDLLQAQASLNRLERELHSNLDAGFTEDLVSTMNGSLGYQARAREPMPWEEYVAIDGPENAFHTWAVYNAGNPLRSPRPADDDLRDINLLDRLKVRPLEKNLNYINEFLNQRLGLSPLSAEPVANPRHWYIAASAYLRLAAENPQHFRRIDPKRLDEVIQAGTKLEDFFRAITFVKSGPGDQMNRGIYDAVLDYYEEKLNAFRRAEAALAPEFNVSMWRQWEARAPRVAVNETVVTGPCHLPRIPTDVIGIAAGPYHSLLIRANGTVVAWGYNEYGQCEVPDGLTDVVSVSAGEFHSLALKKDGTIVAWGNKSQCENIPKLEAITKISAGDIHNLALSADGRVIAWGSNSTGACDVPEEAKAGVVDIAASSYWVVHDDPPSWMALHPCSLALKANGTVVSWGGGKVPDGLCKVVAIATCSGRAVAVRADGTVIGWCLGDPRPGPERYLDDEAIDDVNGVAAVALGINFTLALKTDGTVEVIAGSIEGTPKMTGTFVAIAAGYNHALGLREEGTVVRWPASVLWDNTLSIQGIASSCKGRLSRDWLFLVNQDQILSESRRFIPQDLGPVTAIVDRYGDGLALKANGTIVEWPPHGAPDSLKDVVAIAASQNHRLALMSDGKVEAWPDKARNAIPLNLSNVVDIAAIESHNLALRADGTVVAWPASPGDTASDAVLDVPKGLDSVVAISAGHHQDLALKANGTVVAWRWYNGNEGDVPGSLEDVVAIAAGYMSDTSLALKADGRIEAWADEIHFTQFQYRGFANQTGVLALAGDGLSFLVSSTTSSTENAEPLYFVRGEPPRAVMYRLREFYDHLLPEKSDSDSGEREFHLDLKNSLEQLEGAKVLLESVLALGLPDTLDQDDVLRGFLFGSESLIDRAGLLTLYEAERDRLRTDEWRRRPSTLEETPRERLRLFRERLKERLDALEQSGTPEIPRMVAHTLVQLRLLRAAHPGNASVIN